MTIRAFLSIIGALGVIHGVAFIIAPYQVASFYGLEQSLAVAFVSRLFGGALLAWGAILWLAKSFREEAAVRTVLVSTGIAEAVSLWVVIAGTGRHHEHHGLGRGPDLSLRSGRVFEFPSGLKRLAAL
jgi:hypothetical protein